MFKAPLRNRWARVLPWLWMLGSAAGIVRADEIAVKPVAGEPVLLLSRFDLAPFGYSIREFFVSGTATAYALTGAPRADGQWNAVPAERAPYVTRIVVVRPEDPAKFNGTVAVEWLNVTAGTDASPEWNMMHREILRSGYAYVGVSAQKAGIDGVENPSGMAIGMPLKKLNVERYASLRHPGDAYSFDMYSQVGRAILANARTGILGPLVPRRILAMGESQSAAFLTTYVNAVDPLAKVYDGFLIHSRFGGAASLRNPSMAGSSEQPPTIQFRRDLRVPVLAVETETDVLDGRLAGYRGARQPDHERLRVWEVAGTAHADNYSFVVGGIDSGAIPLKELAAAWAPMDEIHGNKLTKPINNAPQHHYVVQNALVSLDRWVGENRSTAQRRAAESERRRGRCARSVRPRRRRLGRRRRSHAVGGRTHCAPFRHGQFGWSARVSRWLDRAVRCGHVESALPGRQADVPEAFRGSAR